MLAVALAALVVGCVTPTTPDARPGAGTSSPGAAATPAITPLPLSVTEVKYGALSVRTAPGVRCGALLQIAGGYYGDLPPGSLPEQSAGPDGLISWTYPTPRIPAGTGSYTANCQNSTATETKSGSFTVPTHPIAARSLSVRVTTELPPREPINPDPSLVPLRDSSFAKIKETLATEWKSATRGLGSLRIDDSSADITMYVVASRGISVHRSTTSDDSQDIVIYVSDQVLGRRTVENNVAVALHELGHIWCCHGPDANDSGHWVTKQASPGLYGVDKYGLMTDPVTCVSFGAVLSCPNRFSDREMLALGFTDFPPPAPDPCITQVLSLQSELNSLGAQIRSIEAQYPRGIPGSIYDSYVAMVDRYNSLVSRRNALPCDAS
jgi:hypothetical protein